MADDISLSIVIAVVSGGDALRRCLAALSAQIDTANAEVIVPYDDCCSAVGTLAAEFPRIRFQFIDGAGIGADVHALYDARRAAGLTLARGRIIAMTEDHALPAPDWCRQILAAHEQPHAAIGGAVENDVDRPLNWAWYYCDFGRYGRPFESGATLYASDVNIAYKREALESVRELWSDRYQETLVHWALHARGEQLFLDPRMVVYEHRPALPLFEAYRERIAWGRAFAATRAAGHGIWYRLAYAAGTPILPALMLARVLRHMLRQRRSSRQMAMTLPLALLLLTGWALGECVGYVSPGARR